MDETTKEAYRQELMTKKIEDLTSDLQNAYNKIDLILTVNNSLEELDITDGGGTPEVQAEYQLCLLKVRLITEEIDRRHIMEMLK